MLQSSGTLSCRSAGLTLADTVLRHFMHTTLDELELAGQRDWRPDTRSRPRLLQAVPPALHWTGS